MDNQHRKISGYRELSQEEIDLMNAVKAKSAEMGELVKQIRSRMVTGVSGLKGPELHAFYEADPFTWLTNGAHDIQTGVMKVIRAITQPKGF
ncbi:hypothetical protein WK13_34530 [Burkholderia ubonensis]|uniref:Acb2/Tad1 domain-containing protein n=1 Tax=Burkholderia ubonensis TaxID=101571 RepID=UPI0007590460|nr:hypothetical protein [Burkholderia ubonensis]KVR21656.1 hypothetical protein WK13_34530 [Burkholderia ubonensis]